MYFGSRVSGVSSKVLISNSLYIIPLGHHRAWRYHTCVSSEQFPRVLAALPLGFYMRQMTAEGFGWIRGARSYFHQPGFGRGWLRS